MKKKLLLSFLTLLLGVGLFIGCNTAEKSKEGNQAANPTVEEQDLLNLCNLYIACNDFSSANTLVETSYSDKNFFKKSKNNLEEKEESLKNYVTIMKQAKNILDQMVYPEGSIPLYSQLNTLQSSARFAEFLEYLGPGGSFIYVPHPQLATTVEQYETTQANGIAIHTGKNCDCVYWYIGSFYGTTKNSGVLVHTEGDDAVVITGLDYELVRVVLEKDKENAYVEPDNNSHEIEDTVEQPAIKETIEFVMKERVADGIINEYFFKNSSYERKITGPIKNGLFDGEVTFTEFVDDIAYTGTGIAHNGVFERLTDAVPNDVFETNSTHYVCAALYDPYGDLYSLKLSSTQGLAEMYHHSVCPEKYQVYSTARDGQLTAFPFVNYKDLYRMNVNFTTLSGDNVLFTLNGPVSIAECSSDDFNSLTLYTTRRTRYLSAKTLGSVVSVRSFEETDNKADIIPADYKLVNLPKDTIISWLDNSTTYTEGSYYSVFESAPLSKESAFYLTKDGTDSITIKHPTIGKTILRVTTTDVTGIVYDGYIVFMENYKTGMRYHFSYMVERSLFDADRDLEIAQSITLLNS
ncbi:MAG: hypothetical protein IKJ15_00905 [Lachnospiraceae bacterium]|nr:hypothetical protein [Lachnospiraceae bacterium]